MPATRSADNEVRSATLTTAMRLFASYGYDGTALQDIADAVGVSKPAVLHHYPSKEHLRQAVLDSVLEHWSRTLPRLLVAATAAADPAAASHDRFDAVFGELVRFFAEDPDRARILLRETLDRPVELRAMLQRVVRPLLSMIGGYVRAGREAGRNHPDLDDEAWVLHAIQLVVMATACGSVTRTVLEGDSGGRYDRELVRFARSALFTSEPLAPPRATAGGKRKTARHAKRA
jgi:AcrR family transcriptional regulator